MLRAGIQFVQDRVGWRAAVFTGAKNFEDKSVQPTIGDRER